MFHGQVGKDRKSPLSLCERETSSSSDGGGKHDAPAEEGVEELPFNLDQRRPGEAPQKVVARGQAAASSSCVRFFLLSANKPPSVQMQTTHRPYPHTHTHTHRHRHIDIPTKARTCPPPPAAPAPGGRPAGSAPHPAARSARATATRSPETLVRLLLVVAVVGCMCQTGGSSRTWANPTKRMNRSHKPNKPMKCVPGGTDPRSSNRCTSSCCACGCRSVYGPSKASRTAAN